VTQDLRDQDLSLDNLTTAKPERTFRDKDCAHPAPLVFGKIPALDAVPASVQRFEQTANQAISRT